MMSMASFGGAPGGRARPGVVPGAPEQPATVPSVVDVRRGSRRRAVVAVLGPVHGVTALMARWAVLGPSHSRS